MTQKELEFLVEQTIVEVTESEKCKPELPQIKSDRPWGQYCDHSVLRAYTPKSILKKFCEEAIEYGAYSVAVCPANIPYVVSQLDGTGIKAGAAIGFPLGNTTSSVKAFEAGEAVDNGAGECDMVINIGALRDGDYKYVYDEIVGVKKAIAGRVPLKVILETCYLSREEKIACSVIAKVAGADYIKTSTGFGTGGATVEDVILMRRAVRDEIKVKASTNIDNRKIAEAMVKAGADRLGISRLIAIVTDVEDAYCASMENRPPKYN